METKRLKFRRENNYLQSFSFIQNNSLSTSQKILNATIDEFSKVQQDFIWSKMKPKMCMDKTSV